MPDDLNQVATYSLPFVSYSLTGIQNLRCFFKQDTMPETETKIEGKSLSLPGLNKVVEHFSANNTRVILTMGKGGVGKTTMASAIAVGLVIKGHKVHLTTTDPAAHLEFVFQNSELNDQLTISRIDPKKEEVEAYKAEVLSKLSNELDEEALAYIKEDLNSPCTEEIAVFRTFAEVVARSEDEIVVIDTAPTGHTLLLLGLLLSLTIRNWLVQQVRYLRV